MDCFLYESVIRKIDSNASAISFILWATRYVTLRYVNVWWCRVVLFVFVRPRGRCGLNLKKPSVGFERVKEMIIWPQKLMGAAAIAKLMNYVGINETS